MVCKEAMFASGSLFTFCSLVSSLCVEGSSAWTRETIYIGCCLLGWGMNRSMEGQWPKVVKGWRACSAPDATLCQQPLQCGQDAEEMAFIIPSWNTDQGVWRICEYLGVKPLCAMKVKDGNPFWAHHRPTMIRWRKVWVWASTSGPERWWTMHDQSEARGNSGGGSKRF